MKQILFLFTILSNFAFSQNYTSYFTGNQTDVVTNPKGGVCLMGGATEHDEAMKWFLKQANLGDVLVLRASGSDGYNDYFMNQLGITINSVETIVCNNANSTQETYIHDKIKKAEAIWFAGGDQWDYISYWRNTPIDSLINEAINVRKIVIGGTSAGMAIQGSCYFTAENGTVTSPTALANPFSSLITVSNLPFLQNEYLENVITDTHYDNPDRKGRQVVFLSRMFNDFQIQGKGIACDEYTSVCIDSLGMCKIYGDYPSYDEDVYFIQTNCELTDLTPESCEINTPLTWNKGNASLKVYHAKGTMNGVQTFNLNDWLSGSGGVWENWYVENGVLTEVVSLAPACNLENSIQKNTKKNSFIFENPIITGKLELKEFDFQKATIFDLNGKIQTISSSENEVNVSELTSGMYFLYLTKNNVEEKYKILILN